jgi:hypothetical protein
MMTAWNWCMHRAFGLQKVEAPRISRQSAQKPYALAAFTPKELSLILLSLSSLLDARARVRPEVSSWWKIPITPPGIEPATFRLCSAVPQPAAPPPTLWMGKVLCLLWQRLKESIRSFRLLTWYYSATVTIHNLCASYFVNEINANVITAKFSCHWEKNEYTYLIYSKDDCTLKKTGYETWTEGNKINQVIQTRKKSISFLYLFSTSLTARVLLSRFLSPHVHGCNSFFSFQFYSSIFLLKHRGDCDWHVVSSSGNFANSVWCMFGPTVPTTKFFSALLHFTDVCSHKFPLMTNKNMEKVPWCY